jgi:hypothetical protein
MLRAIRSSQRPTTLMTRVTAALPALPGPHRKRRRRVATAPIVGAAAGLVVVLVGIAAVVFRSRLVAAGCHGDGGEEQASDATERELASSVTNGDGDKQQAPVPSGK